MPDNNPVPPDYFEKFVEQLEGIRLAVEATNKLIPEQNAAALQDMAAFYERGFSANASRTFTDPLVRELREIKDSLSQPQEMDEDFRRALSAIAAQQGTGPTRRNHLDPREAEAGGYRPTGGASTTPSLTQASSYIRNWRDNITPDHLERGVLEMPRSEGARFTPQDLLNWAGDTLLGKAANRQSEVAARREDLSNQMESAPNVDEFARLMTERRNLGAPEDAGRGSALPGSVMKWAAAQAPQVAAFRQIANRFGVDASPGSLSAQGETMGRNPGGEVQIGPFGFRSPINAATLSGAKREWEIQKMRMGAGINGTQAREIFDQLNARGFSSEADQKPWQQYGSEHISAVRAQMQPRPTFGAMADSLKYLTRKNPALLNEQTVTLQDKATRSGGETLAQFNKVMADVPQVAQRAGYSMQQLQSDMDAVGEAYESMGGTHAAGQGAAKDFLGLTKTPSALLPGLMQNPWVQTAAMRQTGLMPWEQGLMSGDQWGVASSSAVKDMFNATSAMPAARYNAGKGFVGSFSSKDRRLALVSQQLGIPVTQARQQLDNYNTIQRRGKLGDRANIWSTNIGHLTDPHQRQLALKGQYKLLDQDMIASHFTLKERESVRDAAKVDPKDKHVKDMLKHGRSLEQIAASQQFNKINSVINKKTDKVQSDAHVTVELGRNAKRAGFFIDNKKKAGAGETTVNLPYGHTLTEIPSSQMPPSR